MSGEDMQPDATAPKKSPARSRLSLVIEYAPWIIAAVAFDTTHLETSTGWWIIGVGLSFGVLGVITSSFAAQVATAGTIALACTQVHRAFVLPAPCATPIVWPEPASAHAHARAQPEKDTDP